MNEHHIKEDILKALRLLSSNSTLTQRGVSMRLNISLGKANYLLQALAKQGLIEVKKFAEKGKKFKKIQYLLTKGGFEEKARLTYYYLQMKEKEYFELKKESEAYVIARKEQSD